VPSVGPMARSVEDCSNVMKLWLNSKQLIASDPFLPPVPWRDAIYHQQSNKLKVGYYTYDGWFDAAPACQRAVKEAVEILRQLGHEVIEWNPPNVTDIVRCYYGIMTGDGAQHIIEGLEGEEPLDMYKTILSSSSLPSFIVSLLSGIMKCTGEQRLNLLMNACKPKSTYEYYKYVSELQSLKHQFIDQWNQSQLDCIICPASALPALQHSASKDLTASVSYTFLYNAIPLPAGVIPMTHVREDEQSYTCSHNDRLTQFARRVCEQSAGLPIGVQIVTKPWEDELCLNIMKLIEQNRVWNPINDTWKQIDQQILNYIKINQENKEKEESNKVKDGEENNKEICTNNTNHHENHGEQEKKALIQQKSDRDNDKENDQLAINEKEEKKETIWN
jgi:fatty acid amide hydrolase